MKTLALVSGGKDSCFSMMHCVLNGHEIIALGNLSSKRELDSFMYQTVGNGVLDLYPQVLGLPLYKIPISESDLSTASKNTIEKDSDVEDLYNLILKVKVEFPELQAVCTGAILSNYQRIRVEYVCSKLGLTSLSYLWMRDQEELLSEMIDSNLDAILVKTACIGLDSKHLGKSLRYMQPVLLDLNEMYGVHVCGEGGEYETITLDCPLFRFRIKLLQTRIVTHSDDLFAPVVYLDLINAELQDKNIDSEWKQHLAAKNAFKDACKEVEFVKGDLHISWQYHGALDAVPSVTSSVSYHFPFYSKSITSASSLSNLSLAEETKIVLEKFEDELGKHNLSFSDVVLVTAYISNMNMFHEFNDIYKAYFGVNPSPRVTVEFNNSKNTKVRLEFLAYRQDDELGFGKESLHVQGISYWAPANIGYYILTSPYSQACRIADQVIMAGSIGIIPESMLLPEASNSKFLQQRQLELECGQSMANCINVAKAMKVDLYKNAIFCLCFVTNFEFIATARQILKYQVGDICAVIVVCSSLPMGALVEWHFVSFSSEGFISLKLKDPNNDPSHNIMCPERHSSMVISENDSLEVVTNVTECGYSSYVTVRCMNASADETKRISVTVLDSVINSVYVELIEKLNSIVSLKLYCIDVLPIDYVLSRLNSLFSKATGCIPSISCIPVTGLEGNALITASAFCFKYTRQIFIEV